MRSGGAAGGELPEAFEVYLGSSQGSSYGVWWDGERLLYERFAAEYRGWEQWAIVPSRAQWRRFWASLDAIGVWAWRARYEPAERFAPGTAARTDVHWSLTLAHAGRQVSSSGESAGPHAADLDEDEAFNAFLEAISRLLGGRPFA